MGKTMTRRRFKIWSRKPLIGWMQIQMRSAKNMKARKRKLKKCGDQLLLLHMVHKEEHQEVCREWEVCLAAECLVEEWAVCLEWETSHHRVAETHLVQRLMKWINFKI